MKSSQSCFLVKKKRLLKERKCNYMCEAEALMKGLLWIEIKKVMIAFFRL